MSDKKLRNNFTVDEKLAILREHLIEKKPISEVCEKHSVAPSVFYAWQKILFENGGAAFTRDNKSDAQKRKLEEKVAALEAKVAHKEHVIARVTEEYVKVKKEFGET